jgi:AMMECR1 domain-containing protein
MDAITIEISVLSALEPLAVKSRTELLSSLRPGIDGLLIEDSGRRATFLPKVWDKISSPEAFIEQLMLKAGLPVGHWSETIRVRRYSTLTFAEN